MPKPTTPAPDAIRPYIFHGVPLRWRDGRREAPAACPWCGREGKFSVNTGTGEYGCLSGDCQGAVKGNGWTFIRTLYEECLRTTEAARYEALAADRGLREWDTLVHWGVAYSGLSDCWLLPGTDAAGKLNQVYRYGYPPGGGKRVVLPTPTFPHQLGGVPLYDADRGTVYLCEGYWDAMCWWEALRGLKRDADGSLVPTGNPEVSLLRDASVLAVPGANVFAAAWLPLLADKTVVLMFDNDHPVLARGQVRDGAGLAGCKRVVGLLTHAERPPREVRYLRWGVNEQWTDALPGGYDLRDVLTRDPSPGRAAAAGGVLQSVTPVPDGWVGERGQAKRAGKVDTESLPCTSWGEVMGAWRESMNMSEGLERALVVAFATGASTGHVGDQLWVKLMGPAGCGKSTICEALTTAKNHVRAFSSITGFHSGYKSDKDGDEDHSVIPMLDGMMLVTKDGDSMLTFPGKDQMLSEARDLYDRCSRKFFRHGMNRRYDHHSMTWLLCGTSSLRQLDSSELGERFLSCYLMEVIDPAEELGTALLSVNRMIGSFGSLVNGKAETADRPEKVQCKRLTGGYMNHLRSVAPARLRALRVPPHLPRVLVDLGTLAAYMRARPSKRQDEYVEREYATRLSNQLTLLAGCAAVVLERPEVDSDVMRIVGRVAWDTARGRTLELVRHVGGQRDNGCELGALAAVLSLSEDKTRDLVFFLHRLGALEHFRPELGGGVRGGRRWRLTARMRQLYAGAVNACKP
jgi:energy-coupling factor transporter ATP-binding protein EcfA2